MKKAILFLITIYQNILSPFIKQTIGVTNFCKFTPTCSAYARTAVEKYGVIKGVKVAMIRFLHCQPFSNSYESI